MAHALAAGAGWVTVDLVALLCQSVGAALLAVLGAGVGGGIAPALIGSLFAGGISLA